MHSMDLNGSHRSPQFASEGGCGEELAQQFNIRGQNVDMIRPELELMPATSQACICREPAPRSLLAIVNHFFVAPFAPQ